LFIEAAQLYRTARCAGFTVRSSVDCLIAACAVRQRVGVLHLDRDFDVLARIAPFESRNIRR
jgi:predicted nucleic acid-binding protein